jgi:hypothetical protein
VPVVVEDDVVEGAEVEPAVGTGVPSDSETGESMGAAFGGIVVLVDGVGVDPSKDAVGELVVAVGVLGVLPVGTSVGTSVLSSLGV